MVNLKQPRIVLENAKGDLARRWYCNGCLYIWNCLVPGKAMKHYMQWFLKGTVYNFGCWRTNKQRCIGSNITMRVCLSVLDSIFLPQHFQIAQPWFQNRGGCTGWQPWFSQWPKGFLCEAWICVTALWRTILVRILIIDDDVMVWELWPSNNTYMKIVVGNWEAWSLSKTVF